MYSFVIQDIHNLIYYKSTLVNTGQLIQSSDKNLTKTLKFKSRT